VQFYSDAEAVLARLSRRGVSMIVKAKRDGTSEPYKPKDVPKLVKRLRDRLGLGPAFTLDACRHGGMTELAEAELTDGQGRALSGHRAQRGSVRAMPNDLGAGPAGDAEAVCTRPGERQANGISE
jgi:hypothetical protein